MIFDLWQTLVDWPLESSQALKRTLARRLGIEPDELERRWRATYVARETGPLAEALRSIGVRDEHVAPYVAEREAETRKALRPRPGVLETLGELRRRGLKLGLISMCSEDVPTVWPESELAQYFDAVTFSATCGVAKPDPEIYLLTARELSVEPLECLYVGDGANNELRGAEGVGMMPVLLAPDGDEPTWEEVRDWDGLRISSISEVLELVA